MITGSTRLRVLPAAGKDDVDNLQNHEEELLKRAVVRLSGNVLGLVFGTILALVIFVATNWLVLKGGTVIGPHGSPVVGPHLSLLGQFFIGYSVTFVGSLIGMVYAFICGYLSGLILAWIYNGVVSLTARPRR